MENKEQWTKDLTTLGLSDEKDITIKSVTAKYKALAKVKHPDRSGGCKSEFQELVNAYRRLISKLEKEDPERVNHEKEN